MTTSPWTTAVDAVRAELPEVSTRDRQRLARRLDGVQFRGRNAPASSQASPDSPDGEGAGAGSPSTPDASAPSVGTGSGTPRDDRGADHRTGRNQRGRRRRPDARTLDPAAELARIEAEVAASTAWVAARRARMPKLHYPENLPVSRRKDDLLAAIRDHQVVIVAGETGSGKTTQLPKICLELGRGVHGLIGHTQPRRIAARSVAERIAEELGRPLGETVGYTVRFTDRSSDETMVRVMTDGVLLAEIQRDRLLSRYDTLIIDEAHERSLTIDFLLGYLKQLLPRRPDLKIVITSATIDPEAFSRHFDGAPVVEVSGRTYPVEVRYRPLALTQYEDEEDDGSAPVPHPPQQAGTEIVRDPIQAVCEAVDELAAAGPGDVLVFFSGEREIRDAADALRRSAGPDTEVVPLYARLSAAEQHKVFTPHSGRRIVLATNVAETSLTVPGIRYVVDPGTARISRYSYRTKVQRLPIEPVSQASADQRKGRCGRLADGICIRLYSEEDFEARPAFTEPEILRTNLASVILQMTSLGLGEVAAFPFLDPPDPRQIRDGVALLDELGAIDPDQANPGKRLTPLGRTLAQLPVDPRLARMLVEGDRNGCLADVLVIVSALSIQDPRERPVEKQAQADQQHARFRDPRSDFLTYLNLWNYLIRLQNEMSSSRFRRTVMAEFLHHQRIREWQDLHGQLRTILRQAGMSTPNPRADDDAAVEGSDGPDGVTGPAEPVADSVAERIHLSLLPGLLSQVGLKEGESREYLGARGAKFMIQPGSALARSTPRWVMVGELVETSRLWGRTAARVDPLWVERLAAHLVKRSYSEPRWERKRVSAVATERVTLHGIPVVTGRTVPLGRVDPELSRELFIRHALVEGDWRTQHRFFHENRRLLEDVGDLEDRARRRDILVDDETLFAFYDQRIPADVVSGAHFDSWWSSARRDRPDLLSFWTSMLFSPQAPEVSGEDYPTVWRYSTSSPEGTGRNGDSGTGDDGGTDGTELAMTYQFEPGTAADGVTLHLPLTLLATARQSDFEWQIPGLREELVTELIRSLPKPIRRQLAPAPDRARAALKELDAAGTAAVGEELLPALERVLRRQAGVEIPREAWDLAKVPGHLRITFQVTGEDGKVLAEGKDLDVLREKLRPQLREAISDVVAGVERTELTGWTFGELPRSLERTRAGLTVRGYPALVDRGRHVDVRVLESGSEQARQMRAGTRRLLLLQIAAPAKAVLGRLSNQQKLALAQAPHPTPGALFDDCLAAAVDAIVDRSGGPVWDQAAFEALALEVRGSVVAEVTDVVARTASVLAAARDVDAGLRSTSSPALLASLADLRAQLTGLVHPGFVTEAGAGRLPDLLRYLQAMARRLDKLPERYDRDRGLLAEVAQVQAEYDDAVAALPRVRRADDDVRRVRWMIEELRVSLFGSGMRTAYPVSAQRVLRAIDDLA